MKFEICENSLNALLHQKNIPGKAEVYLTEQPKDLVDYVRYVFKSRARSNKYV